MKIIVLDSETDGWVENVTKLHVEDYIKKCFSYEPETGKVFWKFSPNNRIKVGQEVLCKAGQRGQVTVTFEGKTKNYRLHRIAWLLYYGSWPKGLLDHINNNPSDNRIVNLRECSHTENMKNQGLRKDNSTGYKGVCYRPSKSGGRYTAQIYHNNKLRYIGSYRTAEQAASAYDEAAILLHKGFAKTNADCRPRQ